MSDTSLSTLVWVEDFESAKDILFNYSSAIMCFEGSSAIVSDDVLECSLVVEYLVLSLPS